LNFENKEEFQKEVNLVPQRKRLSEFEKLREDVKMFRRTGINLKERGILAGFKG